MVFCFKMLSQVLQHRHTLFVITLQVLHLLRWCRTLHLFDLHALLTLASNVLIQTCRFPKTFMSRFFNSMITALTSRSGAQLALTDSFYNNQPLLAVMSE